MGFRPFSLEWEEWERLPDMPFQVWETTSMRVHEVPQAECACGEVFGTQGERVPIGFCG